MVVAIKVRRPWNFGGVGRSRLAWYMYKFRALGYFTTASAGGPKGTDSSSARTKLLHKPRGHCHGKCRRSSCRGAHLQHLCQIAEHIAVLQSGRVAEGDLSVTDNSVRGYIY